LNAIKDIKKGPPYEFSAEFISLKWKTLGVNSLMKLSFASVMQHHTKQAAVSHRIYVENTASSIIIEEDPPEEVTVNQIFEIKVFVAVSGGYPLANALVTCNLTNSMDFSNVSTEIFTSLANTEYNVQKSSLLAPRSKLDDSRTSATTDRHGEASLYLRISESPINSEVRIICQSGEAMTPPSPNIKVKHPISKITQRTNFTETVKPSTVTLMDSFEQEFLSKLTLCLIYTKIPMLNKQSSGLLTL